MKTKKRSLKQQVEYYADLPYTVTVEKEDGVNGAYYVARIIELPDLLMTGETPADAVAELEAVKREWIEEYLRLGNRMPEPLKSRKYSGKVVLRMPASLHETLVKIAELEKVSFNQFMVSVLSESAGLKKVKLKAKSGR